MSTGVRQHPGDARGPPPLRAGDTTPDRPWPVRHLAPKIADYIAKMPPVWVEGQVLNLKKWNTLYFLTLRDTDLDMSLSVTAPAVGDRQARGQVSGRLAPRRARTARSSTPRRATLTFAADDVRLVGLGELLARIEHLKGVLGAEGLFDAVAQAAAAVPAGGHRPGRRPAGRRRARRGVQRARAAGRPCSSRSAA